jgi:hypothetical protein
MEVGEQIVTDKPKPQEDKPKPQVGILKSITGGGDKKGKGKQLKD